MLGIPDAVVHSAAVRVDERHFLGRIDLRDRSDHGAYEKPQIPVPLSRDIGVEEWRMRWVVNGTQDVRVYVVDRRFLEYGLREAFRHPVPVPQLVFRSLQRLQGFLRSRCLRAEQT